MTPLERLVNAARNLYLSVPVESQDAVRIEVNYWIDELESAIEDAHPHREVLAVNKLRAVIDRWTA